MAGEVARAIVAESSPPKPSPSMTTSSLTQSVPSVLPDARRVLAASLVVALLDGLYVVLVFAVPSDVVTAPRLFQGIAVPLFGPGMREGGWWTSALGAFLHTGVALVWSMVWALLLGRSARIRHFVQSLPQAIAIGVGYGVVVHLAMQCLVIPLTPHGTPGPLLSRPSLLVLLAHLLVVGPPIVLMLRTRGR
jgi:hypothetical protein